MDEVVQYWQHDYPHVEDQSRFDASHPIAKQHIGAASDPYFWLIIEITVYDQ